MTTTTTGKAERVEHVPADLAGRDFLSIDDLSADELRLVLDAASSAKASPGSLAGSLAGRSVVMLFEKPSLRTRMSFEVGLTKLGAHVVYYDQSAKRIGERESVKDYAKNLERWVDCVIARVFEHTVLEEMAQHASIPIVNALSDVEHPCQALADFQTLHERFGTLDGLRLAFVGDGNNVCHSLMLAAAKLGVHFSAITPKGFEPQFEVVRKALRWCDSSGAKIALSHDLADVEGHHAIYTDTWVSMGQGHQSELRTGSFAAFQIDEELMERASRGLEGPSVFMHCLPAHRGEEVTDGVIDSASSVVYDQAENRMHAQNALLAHLLGPGGGR